MPESEAVHASANEALVHFRGVTKTFGSGNAAVQALRGIDLDVYAGELLMLAGPSGCGKTTLISVLAGLIDRDGGEASVLGHDFKTMSRDACTRFRGEHIGFVFQSFDLIPSLTAAENASLPLRINKVDHREAMQRADALLAELDLDERARRALPKELSGGQKQRTALARALAHDPRILVCDEPTSALDADSGHKVMEALGRFAADKARALVVVTHDSRIFEFADRIVQMEDGRIRANADQ
ncbi:ABC transporter ATP-binding protein [Coraliomargarita parva]|uniref:ABC transporter ATP-binding protein n=1 Tax=Coraliomargarita parva TaxID=3014050 RepID=UPI0022B59AFA|nr:ABC transporter ATP-binding protein [Coraliomargarita parva]